MFSLFLLALSLIGAVWCDGDLLLSNVFGDNMVLQRGPGSASVFGWVPEAANVGVLNVRVELLSVTGNGSSDVVVDEKATVSHAYSGFWEVALDPRPASPSAFAVLVSAYDAAKNISLSQKISNVLFGDVWLCGGQSNMQMVVNGTFGWEDIVSRADQYPAVRLVTVSRSGQNIAENPRSQIANFLQNWTEASAHAVGGQTWSKFSALCWAHGRNIYDKTGVPQGLVSSNWGGTVIQTWMSPEALDKCNVPSKKRAPPHWKSFLTGGLPPPVLQDGMLYNGMIVPWIRMKLLAVLWFQGEQNTDDPSLYRCLFPAMISDWRVKFNAPRLPFIFVQLGASTDYFRGGDPGQRWAWTRQAQADALDSLDRVFMAVSMDLGDAYSPFMNVHFRAKEVLGARTAAIALNQLYGLPTPYWGPRPIAAEWLDQTNSVRLSFDRVGAGLRLRLKNETTHETVCPAFAAAVGSCGWFDAELAVGKWTNVTSVALSDTADLLLHTKQRPLQVRYAFADWPIATLYNSFDLPAPPFIIKVT